MLQAEQFRDELMARDAKALARQTRALLAVIRRLDGRIKALADAVGTGSPLRLAEYRALRAQAIDELRKYAVEAAEVIEAAQAANLEAALDETGELVAAQFPRGVSWAWLASFGVEWVRLDPDALAFMVGRMSSGAPLRKYLEARLVRGTIAGVANTLTTGVLDNPRVTARALRTSFAGGMAQALRITRTETLGVYRSAARASYVANSRLVKGYRRHAALDSRTCVVCWILDGTLYASESDFEEHVQGRCYISPELVSWRELGIEGMPEEPPPVSGAESFARLSESEQRALVRNDKQFELLRSGQITLPDLIQRTTHPDFGAQLSQASATASLERRGTLTSLPSTIEITPIETLVAPRIRTAA